tara:strand:- start:433 stop:831 length:399 start_codon:yes stop_codon:yes gene_type:complete
MKSKYIKEANESVCKIQRRNTVISKKLGSAIKDKLAHSANCKHPPVSNFGGDTSSLSSSILDTPSNSNNDILALNMDDVSDEISIKEQTDGMDISIFGESKSGSTRDQRLDSILKEKEKSNDTSNDVCKDAE